MSTEMEHLQRIEEKLDELRMSMAELNGIFPSVCKRISRLEKEIWGDGHIGLSAKVNAIIWLASGIIGLLMISVGNAIRTTLGF
jgi:hypothetical protein